MTGTGFTSCPQGVYQAPSGFTFNRIFTGTNSITEFPTSIWPQSRDRTTSQLAAVEQHRRTIIKFSDDLSWTTGSHQFKFGGGWAIYKKVQDYFAETQGGFGFDGSFTAPDGTCPTGTQCGFDYADFILGDAQHYDENAYKGTGIGMLFLPMLTSRTTGAPPTV